MTETQIVEKNCNALGKFSFHYRENTSDERQLNHDLNMFLIEEYEISPNDTVIDVGAYIGTFSIPLSEKLSSGKIYALEPCLDTFEVLEKNVELNLASNVFIFKLAFFDKVGTTKLYHHPDNKKWADSITMPFSCSHEMVETTTLEKFMTDNFIEECEFMKVNCEGAEFNFVLSSDKATLRKIKLMLILYHCDCNKDYSEVQLIDHLESSGFKVSLRNISKTRGWIVAKKETD